MTRPLYNVDTMCTDPLVTFVPNGEEGCEVHTGSPPQATCHVMGAMSIECTLNPTLAVSQCPWAHDGGPGDELHLSDHSWQLNTSLVMRST